MAWLRELWTQIWITLVVAAVSLALYTSAGRQLIPLVETWQPELEQQLSQILQQPVTIGKMTGGWSRLSPLITFNDVQLGPPGDGVHIASMTAELDVSASAFHRLPVFRRIEVHGIRAEVHEISQREWRIGTQWPLTLKTSADNSTVTVVKPAAAEPLWLHLLSLQQSVIFNDWQLVAFSQEGTREELHVDFLRLRNQGDSHELDGQLVWGRDKLAQLKVMASLEGDLWPWQDQSGQVYLDLDPQDWSRWIPADLPGGINVNMLSAGAKAWLDIRDGDLYALQLDATVPALAIETRAEPVKLTAGKLTVAGRHNGDDWHLQARAHFNEALPFSQFSISAVTLDSGKGWQIGIPQLDLPAARDFLLGHQLLPSPFDRYIAGLAPEGQASDVRFSLLPGEKTRLDIRASLNEISTLAYQGIPAFSALSGDVHLQPQGGVLTVTDDDFTLFLDGVYAQPWQLKQPQGRFYWSIHSDYAQLQVRDLKARLVDGDGQWPMAANLGLALPVKNSGVESSLSLLVGLPAAPAALHTQLVPALIDPGIQSWIGQSLQEGQFSNGAYVMQMALGKEHPANSLSSQLYLAFDQARIRYLQDWPEVSDLRGSLLLRAPELDVHIAGGRTLGGELSAPGLVRIHSTDDGSPALSVNAGLSGDAGEAMRYLTETPLAEVVKHALDDWRASGQVIAQLLLEMPLSGEQRKPTLKLDAALADTRIELPSVRLSFSDIKGKVSYSTDTGLSASALRGRVLGGKFRADIKSVMKPEGMDVVLSGKGRAGFTDIKQWLPLFLLDPVSGEFAYDTRLTIGSGVNFTLTSPMTGTRIDLPYPMGKRAEEERPLLVEAIPGEETRLNIRYADRVHVALALAGGAIDRGQVYLGDSEPFLPADKGIEIRGQVPETLSAGEWWGAWQKLMAAMEKYSTPQDNKDDQSDSGPVRSIDVAIGDVDAWGMPMGLTRVQGSQQWNDWTFDVDSTLVKGNVQLKSAGQPIAMHLTYIHLPGPADGGEQTVVAEDAPQAASTDPLLAVRPQDIPPIDLKLDELYVGSRNFGHWKLQSRPSADGSSIHLLDSDMKGLIVTGNVQWSLLDGQHKTALDVLNITSKDIGRVQREFRQDAVIEGKDMTSVLQLSWQGSPLSIDAASLNGLFSIKVKDGNLAAEGTGALKAFGALNFNSVARRLKLDFSDLYQSGVAFDTLKAKGKIENGVMTFTDPFSLDGPGAKFLTTGSTNLADETLDMKMVVTFPVSGSLPLVALLAGLAPPVAASIYVTEKLIGDELARFTSASYDLKGTWQKPELKINQAFDNKVEGKKDRGVWDRVKSVFQVFGGDD